MHLKSFLAGILVVSFVAAVASTVEPTSITRFQAGTPARADDVNSTIQALVDAIDDNARRIEALEQNKTSCSLVERIKGSTFQLFAHYNVIGGDSFMTSWDSHYYAFGRINEIYTFNEDGTFTANAENNGVFPDYTPGEFETPSVTTVQHASDDFSDDGTWELVGNQLTLTFFDGEITATVSPDGNTAFISIIEPFEEPEQQDSLQVPEDAQQIVLGIATRIEPYRTPEGLSINVTHIDDSHLNGSILELQLTNEGSGGCLEFARSPLNGPVAFATPPENGWTKSNVFVVRAGDTGDFWARRDSNEFVTGPVRYNPPSSL